MRNPDITGFTRIRKSEVGYSEATLFCKIEKVLSDEFFNNRIIGQMRNMKKAQKWRYRNNADKRVLQKI